ncbi:hypothetical protein U9M48_031250 [Paspalum notatum var. saurae]|uniref:Myb-like domain-containing protein n=1 Tax=Paspalum notatum var. saurae TaxID=547442 RepID=A0AAQ3U2F1_PASNO
MHDLAAALRHSIDVILEDIDDDDLTARILQFKDLADSLQEISDQCSQVLQPPAAESAWAAFASSSKKKPGLLNAATTKPRAKAKAKGKGKQVAVSLDASDGLSHRSSNYTVEEDLCLISGWLNNSMDPTVGTNQTYESFWDCVTNYYEQHKPSYSSQSKKSLQHRWDSINTAVSKFVGIKAQQDRLKKVERLKTIGWRKA